MEIDLLHAYWEKLRALLISLLNTFFILNILDELGNEATNIYKQSTIWQ